MVARLGSLGSFVLILPATKVHLCKYLSYEFFIVHMMNFMHALTCQLLWWWYSDTTCSMLNLLPKSFLK